MRFQGSESGAISRDVTIHGGTFENNFNYEINIVDTRNFRMYGGGLNLYAPADAAANGLAANQAAIRIGTGNSGYVFEGQIFTNNVTSYGDIWCFDLATTSPHGRIRLPYFAGATSHIRMQSGVDVVVEGSNVAPAITLTGATPVDCFAERLILGTDSRWANVTPELIGATTAGTRTGGSVSGQYLVDGAILEFDATVIQTSHNGTGGAVIQLSGLPRNFLSTVPVDLYWEGLTYTSPPQAISVSGTKNVVLRQAASGSAHSVINVPAGAATVRVKGRVR